MLIPPGRQIYKWNINNSGTNNRLLDIRNYYNFRCTYDQYYTRVEAENIIDNMGYQYGTAPSKSYYMSNEDFLFSYMYDVDIDPSTISQNVQPIVLNEFQPDVIVYITKILNTLLDTGIEQLKKSDNKLISGITKFFTGAAKTAAERSWSEFSKFIN